ADEHAVRTKGLCTLAKNALPDARQAFQVHLERAGPVCAIGHLADRRQLDVVGALGQPEALRHWRTGHDERREAGQRPGQLAADSKRPPKMAKANRVMGISKEAKT